MKFRKHNSCGMIKPYSESILPLIKLVDGVTIIITWFTCLFLNKETWVTSFGPALLAAISIYILAGNLLGLYRSWRGSHNKEEYQIIAKAWFVVAFTVLFALYVTQSSQNYPRYFILSWLILSPITIIFQRSLIRNFLAQARKRNWNTRSVAIVGTNPISQELADRIKNASWSGLRIESIFTNDIPRGKKALNNCKVKVEGSIFEVIKSNRQKEFDIIYIALPLKQMTAIKFLVHALSNSTSSVYVVPDLFVYDLLGNGDSFTKLHGMPIISVFESPFRGARAVIKRLEDVLLSLLIIPIISIPLILITLSIKLTSKGPAIFRQYRYGLNGKQIVVWKFRTMTIQNRHAPFKQATPDDPRVTRIGQFLRRTSLDELPQFINVLQGRMSIVGPRPHPVALNEQFRDHIPGYMLRHKLKPGITGWAQVNGWRGETNTLEKMKKRVEYDLEYFRKWSFWFDIRIIWMTIMKEFWTSRNAY